MKQALYVLLIASTFLLQCRDKSSVEPSGSLKEINVLDFAVPGVDPKDITIKDNVIVINLPENYTGGKTIKPVITLETGYFTQSNLADGFEYEDKTVLFELQNSHLDRMQYLVTVVPFDAVKLVEPMKQYSLKIESGASISVPVALKGTSQMVDDSGQVVYTPKVIFENKASGTPFEKNPSLEGNRINGISNSKFQIPATIPPGSYRAYIVWGTKKVLLSDEISISRGSLQLREETFVMQLNSKYFEISGYNISANEKYEVIIENDFIGKSSIPLVFKDAGTLSGNIPDNIPAGNYSATYLENGKTIKMPDYPIRLQRFAGFDDFYIRSSPTQPILKMMSQPSARDTVPFPDASPTLYYKPIKEFSRHEPLLAHIAISPGAFPDRNDLVLINIETKKEYVIPYSGDFYPIFGGFIVFLAYHLSDDIPAGNYESYAIFGPENEKSEMYSQIISIK